MVARARPAIIYALTRTGSTFLSCCLSNHPDIDCFRHEPLHRTGTWRAILPEVDVVRLLRLTLEREYYDVAMCKVTYSQSLHEPIWQYLMQLQPKVIWLRRDNTLRHAISRILMPYTREGTWTGPVEMEPSKLIDAAMLIKKQKKAIAQRVKAFNVVLPLSYEEIAGGEGQDAVRVPTRVARRICSFLGVKSHQLPASLRRTHPYALEDIFTNWQEVVEAVWASEFACYLGD